MISSDVFDGKETEINTTIAMHLIRQGQFELADTFIRVFLFSSNLAYQESGLEIPPSLQGEFREMYEILQAMRARNLVPAIAVLSSLNFRDNNRWADKKRHN